MDNINSGYQHEGLDRVDTILNILENRLGYPDDNPDSIHPSIYDEKAKELLLKATQALSDLYQHIGNWDNTQEEK